MQQHHQNVTRAATINTPNHLRGHHLVGMHGNTNTTNMGPSVLNIPKVPQQPAHHIPPNVPSTSKNPSVLSTTTNSSNTHHSRLQHHHNNHQANNGRSSSQMHKPSRQQQQPSNNNNKSNNHPYKLGANLAISNQYKHPTNQQLGYNHINAPNQINHMGVVPQQQRNVIYHNTNPPQQQTQNIHPHLPGLQPPPPPPPSQHMKNPQQHPHQHQQQQPYNAPSTPSKHIAKQHHQQTSRVSHSSSSTSPITTNPSKPPFNQNSHHFYSSNQKFNKNKTQQHQHQQQHHYQNHQNYQNNNLNSNQNPPPYLKNAPKAILQNSNRICKTLPKSSQPELGDVSSTTSPTTLSFNDKNNSKDQSNSSSTASSISSSKTPDEQQMHSSKVLVTTAPQINGGSQSIECGTDAGGGGGGGGSDDKENNPLCSKSNSLDYESNSDETSNNKHNINNNNNNNSNDINTKDNNNDNNFSNNTNNILSNEDLSATKNSKEKTPMCLVNELARYNKIGHQYRLTNEKGPAHCKRFTVTLKLGEEEYTAEGYKIKKAQHLAAAEAIEKTKYKHPIPKATRRNEDGHLGKVNITPTVELNALAMKLGQQTYYLFDPRQMPNGEPHHSPPDGIVPFVGQHPHLMPPPPPPHQIIDPMFIRRNGGNSFVPGPNGPLNHHRFIPNGLQRNGGYNQKYPQRYSMQMSHMPQPGPGGVPMPPPFNPTSCKITLIVGKQRFVGLGRNLQQAKHDAAAKALQVLKNQMNEEANNDLNNSYQDSDNKSPISMVHEIGLKRDMPVHFKVLREEGPAHMKNFITACIVGNIVTEGEGNGKKISKKRAADKMLEELKKLPPLTPTKSPVKRIKVKTPGKAGTPGGMKGGRKRGHSNSIKEKANEENEDENPVSKLIQIQQSRREKEPVFELISKNANEKSRRREFIMEVTVQGMVARGTGSSKKLAKRNAALNLLIAMGLEKENDEQGGYLDLNSSNIDSNSSMNINNISASSTHPSTSGVSDVSDASVPKSLLADLEVPVVSTTAGEVEGILLIRHNKKNAAKKKEQNSGTKQVTEEKRSNAADDVQNVPNSLKELNTTQPDNSNNRSSDALKCDDTRDGSAHETKDSGDSTVNCVNQANGVHMKDQLLYLAKLLGFTVNFSDYPKGNHNEFLSIVTLSTEPPQICHGVGTNAEESQNDAARNALKILSQLGLNCAK